MRWDEMRWDKIWISVLCGYNTIDANIDIFVHDDVDMNIHINVDNIMNLWM